MVLREGGREGKRGGREREGRGEGGGGHNVGESLN